MTDLLIHDSAQILIDSYLNRPAHGLLLTGPAGIGLRSVAISIATKIGRSAYLHHIDPDDKRTIAIETIRGLYKLARAQRNAPLVIIIDDADAMGHEAQNALLKLLEEPTDKTYFILTSHMPQQLLATITSRVQLIPLSPLSTGVVETLIPADTSAASRAQLLFIAQGLPAEITRLQSDEAYFAKRAQQMKDARSFLEGDTYSRLLLSKSYSDNRRVADEFLESLTAMLSFMLFSQHDPRLATKLEQVETIRDRLRQNAHARTQLTYLVTQL